MNNSNPRDNPDIGPDHRKCAVTMLSTFGPGVRGISRYTDELYAALQGREDVSVGKMDYSHLYPELLVPVREHDSNANGEAVMHWRRASTWRRAAEMSSDLMHIQYWSMFTSYMLCAVVEHLHRLGKKAVVTVHNPDPHEHIPFMSRFERQLIRAADTLVVHNETGKRRLIQRFGLDGETIHVIPHGIADHGIHRASEADYRLTGLDPARRYVLIFGNLRGYKGVSLLLRAWRSVAAAVGDVDLVIAGRLWAGKRSIAARLVAGMLGADKVSADMQQLLSEPTLKSRVLLREGLISDDMLDAFCRIAGIGVFPYERFAGQSGAATRAAGWRLPLVVSRVGALPELVADPLQIVEPGDEHGLASGLESLLRDDARLQSAAESQYLKNRDLQWPKLAGAYAILYHGMYRQADTHMANNI